MNDEITAAIKTLIWVPGGNAFAVALRKPHADLVRMKSTAHNRYLAERSKKNLQNAAAWATMEGALLRHLDAQRWP